MAFQQGLSGLNTSSKALDVVSNNIANASTVGFKNAQAQFADVYASALNGGGSSQVGIGASLMAVQQTFTQGNISVTNNPLDIAINGNGFFRLQMSPTDQTGYYTRNGQFHLDKNGYIVNSNGGYLTGYPSTDGVTVNTAAPAPIQMQTGGIPPMQTGGTFGVNPTDSGLKVQVNLDYRSTKGALTVANQPVTDWTTLAAWDLSNLNTNMYNYSTSATVYDQAGQSHTLTSYFTRRNDVTEQRVWDVHYVMDGKYEIPATNDMNGNVPTNTPLSFNADGTLIVDNAAVPPITGRVKLLMDQATTYVDDDADPLTPEVAVTANLTVDPTPGSYDLNWFDPTLPVTIDFAGSTQFGSANDTNNITQDGYGAGMLTRVTVDEDGFVQGNYSNGQTKIMGQVVLTEFRNPNGLQNVGDNMWIETNASGQAMTGTPGAGTRGSLQSGSVEESNTDLTQELVAMITYQRNYQANAQSIKTQDQIMQTLVNLR